MSCAHAMPFGAECLNAGGVRFRLWAPSAHKVELILESAGETHPMPQTDGGWHELSLAQAKAGDRYRFRVDDGLAVPDPASRHNPDDVHAASEVIDPNAFDWQDADWRGRPWHEAVIYELHVGTFTRDGTFQAAIERLDYLADLGITAIELMPLADFPGAHNWGYDGVLQFAPDASYGRPEALKSFIQAAHQRGMMVLLDVVYNHFGPEGNYLWTYARDFFTERHHTPWGAAINYDDVNNRTVRDFFIHNALYWLGEYRFDGLRLDAVHAILDDSQPDILTELAERVHKAFDSTRHVHLVLENDHNAAHYLKRNDGKAMHYAAQWNDDIHHAWHVLLTGERDGYYADYADAPAKHLARCLSEGFAWQGEASPFRKNEARGEPSKQLPAECFVDFLQNHDQVGNRAFGERLAQLAEPRKLHAAAAMLLLSPQPPMLFMGEEFGAATPFLFFCDFGDDLKDAVRDGRRREFEQFTRFADPAVREKIPDPGAQSTFLASKLDWACREREPHRDWLAFYRNLLHLRRDLLSHRLHGCSTLGGQVLAEAAVQASWRLADGSLYTLQCNLGERSVSTVTPPGDCLYAWPAAPDAPGELGPGHAYCYLNESQQGT